MKFSFANIVHYILGPFIITAHIGTAMQVWSYYLHSDLSFENQAARTKFSATVVPLAVCSVLHFLILKVQWSQHYITSSEDIKLIANRVQVCMIGQKGCWIFFMYYSIIDSGYYFTTVACMQKKKENANVQKLVEILEIIAFSSRIKLVNNFMLRNFCYFWVVWTHSLG